jgi:hypothetical protein
VTTFLAHLVHRDVTQPTFTPVFVALVSIINTKLPMVGKLLLHLLRPTRPLPFYDHIFSTWRRTARLPFTPVFVALVSNINTKLPMVGELLLHLLVSLFRRAFK